MAIMRLRGQPEKVRAASNRALETARGVWFTTANLERQALQLSRDWPRS